MQSILLVEDNQINRDLASRRLEIEGYKVIEAHDGQQAIDQAIATRPALILMDLSLPIKDGWTASTEIKAIADLAHIPIIALTAHAMTEDRDRALEAGCNAFHTKPVDFVALFETMERLLNR